MSFEKDYIKKLRLQVSQFLNSCYISKLEYGLTPKSDSSPFTLCFAIFLSHLLGCLNDIKSDSPIIAEKIVKDLSDYKKVREKIATLNSDKYFLQLLSFSLSALYLIDEIHNNPLENIISPLIPKNMNDHLTKIGSYKGIPQSGNLAMCIAVVSIYAHDYLGMKTKQQVNDWVDGHFKHMNKHGFWGEDKISYLQFQNGYHQYEIIEYLGVENPKINNAFELLRNVTDSRGQYAPYYGGSGCYDFDAICILTSESRPQDQEYKDEELMKRLAKTILDEHNEDGGFSESQWVRPRSAKSLISSINHIFAIRGNLRWERLRYFIALQFPKHNLHHTHWTKYSRHWSSSNLWDTWLRLLTIARIDCALNNSHRDRWGFINFPGIGYYSVGKS